MKSVKILFLRVLSLLTALSVLTPFALAWEAVLPDGFPAPDALTYDVAAYDTVTPDDHDDVAVPDTVPSEIAVPDIDTAAPDDEPAVPAFSETIPAEVNAPDSDNAGYNVPDAENNHAPDSNTDCNIPELDDYADTKVPETDDYAETKDGNAPDANSTDVPDFDGYIVTLDTGPRLFSADVLPELDEIYAPDGIYQADSLDVVSQLEQSGLLLSVEPDYIVTLDGDFETFSPAEDARTLSRNGDAETLSLFDGAESVNDTPPYVETQWYESVIGVDYARSHAAKGERVRVGVADSGIFAQHEDFSGTILIPGHNYTVTENDPLWNDISDTYGHGTFVSGLIAATIGNGMGIAGVAPEVELVTLKCFDGKSARISGIARAIYAGVDDYHCQVLNLSLGTETESGALKNAVKYAAEKGIIMVAAAGNLSGISHNPAGDPLNYPAAWDSVISTGSIEPSQANDGTVQISRFSLRNESVWITAPGNNLRSLDYTGGYRTNYGTSFAAPMVTAAAALALSIYPALTRSMFMDLLSETAEDLGDPGYDTTYGYGMLRIDSLLSSLAGVNWTLLTEQVHSMTELYDADLPVMFLVAYAFEGTMLSCQMVSGNTELLPAEQARLWKLFVLKPLTFEPMRDSEDFYGGAWVESAPPPDGDTEAPPADDSGETPGDDSGNHSGDNSEETPGDNSGNDDSGANSPNNE